MIKHSGHLRTLEKCRKHSPAARVFYISLVFSNARRVLSQCNTRLRLLYLLTKTASNCQSYNVLITCPSKTTIVHTSKPWSPSWTTLHFKKIFFFFLNLWFCYCRRRPLNSSNPPNIDLMPVSTLAIFVVSHISAMTFDETAEYFTQQLILSFSHFCCLCMLFFEYQLNIGHH